MWIFILEAPPIRSKLQSRNFVRVSFVHKPLEKMIIVLDTNKCRNGYGMGYKYCLQPYTKYKY